LKYGGFLSSIILGFPKKQFNILVRKIIFLGVNLFIKILFFCYYEQLNYFRKCSGVYRQSIKRERPSFTLKVVQCLEDLKKYDLLGIELFSVRLRKDCFSNKKNKKGIL